MRFLTPTETRAWLAARGLPHDRAPVCVPAAQLSYRVPVDSGKKTALSRALLGLLASKDEALLLITEHGVWPSCEDLFLFDGFRRSLGETRSLNEAPGLVFSSGDLPQATSILAMALYFVWGVLLVSPAKDLLVELSHDEVMDVGCLAGPGIPKRIASRIGRIAGSPLPVST